MMGVIFLVLLFRMSKKGMKLMGGRCIINSRTLVDLIIKIKFICIFIFFLSYRSISAQDIPLSGLYFSSHEVIKDQRTSLNLSSNKTYNFSKGFTLEFDANFRRGDGHYGYIFRMIDDEKNNIDLVSNLASEIINFSLVLKDCTLISYRWQDIPNGDFDEWINVKVHVDPIRFQISLALNNYEKVKQFSSPIDFSRLNIVFGACNLPFFLNSDVSPMTIKDIRFYDNKQNLYRYWKLSKHGTENVYDEIENAPAEVKNPIWLINRHTQWKHLKKIQFNDLLGVAQNDATGQIYFVDKDAIFSYSSDSKVLDTINYLGGRPFHCKGSQVIFNVFTQELWSYNFDRGFINKFNFDNKKWSHSDSTCPEPDFWHHTKFISPLDTSLFTFGGYGHYNYKNLVKKIGKNGKWEDHNLVKEIHPRYLSSLGFLSHDEILIFGGYGSKSGKQELSPEFYHDLYKVDLKNLSVEKLWISEEDGSFVPSANLIYNSITKSFFTLLYNSSHFETSLSLANFGLDAPDKKILADPIPYKFLDTESWCNLFLNKEETELLAVTVNNSQMNLYSLAYPPLALSEVFQKETLRSNLAKLLAFFLLSVVLLSLFIIARKKIKNKIISSTSSSGTFEAILNQHVQTQKQKVSAIYLFGGLQIFDRNGIDITVNFTPTLKELFIIIFLHTLKNGKGVSSQVLDEALWFDKSGESARNNRNVNISKLRPLLDEIGHLELAKEGTFWKINHQPEFYCDYLEVLHLLVKINNHPELNENEIYRLLSVASSGEFLPDIQNEWIDPFKSDFSNLLIDSLLSLSEQLGDRKAKNNILYHLAESILKHDTLNEDAIAIKCSVLYNLGKKGLAKHSYESFCRGFKNIMGDDFKVSFDGLVKQKIM